ncbi:putative N-terminal region of Chorein, a TM vesicle-mediated sorter [Trypanosoma cruzi]|uniref:Putative N-terminal region of Chorein, a TM vesicle-mediated sorter n=1 Tax=Trypanosoma cruzi TaxID=5693 RepID=A0A2V2UKV0_TRYCR|nr:putative N-terminal region of Chorein, a TM vesicle-mediated sorter [Trypanosoma cruzi]
MENAWIISKKGEISFSDNKHAALLHAEKVAVLENGEHIHISTSLQPGTLAQNVTFRTVFHVKNYLSYNISFRSMRQGSEVAMIRPGELLAFLLVASTPQTSSHVWRRLKTIMSHVMSCSGRNHRVNFLKWHFHVAKTPLGVSRSFRLQNLRRMLM